MRRFFAINSLVIVLTAMVTITTAQVDMPFGGYYCFVRCIAKCIENTTRTLPACSDQCTKYKSNALCASSDSICWLKCKDLVDGVDAGPPQPTDLNAVYREDNPQLVNITWTPVPLVSLYVLEYDDQFDNWTNPKRKEITAPMLSDFTKPEIALCNQFAFRVASVTVQGVSQFSNEFLLLPMPKMEPALDASFLYVDEPYRFMHYNLSNATIVFTIEYSNLAVWPPGANDITFDVDFAIKSCDVPDLSNVVPMPAFKRIPGTNLLTTNISSDLLTRRCELMYYLRELKSNECNSSFTLPISLNFIKITCENVENSNCSSDIQGHDPVCGQVTDVKVKRLNPDKVNVNDLGTKLSAEISFTPFSTLIDNKKPLYYMVAYGYATQFEDGVLKSLQGVNMTNTIGQVSTCDRLQLNETCNGNITTAVITGLQFDRLYGVMVCAILDKDHLKLPRIDPTEEIMISIRADGLLIKSDEYRHSHTVMILSITVALVLGVVAVIFIFFYWRKKQSERMAIMDIRMSRLNDALEAHYGDSPKNTYIDRPARNT